jgi:hypothetical protein
MIKVVTHDSFGNVGACTSSESFIIGPLIPLPPQDMVLHAINPTDMQISWTPVNQGALDRTYRCRGIRYTTARCLPPTIVVSTFWRTLRKVAHVFTLKPWNIGTDSFTKCMPTSRMYPLPFAIRFSWSLRK